MTVSSTLPRIASALLAATVTLVLLAAFLVPGVRRPTPAPKSPAVVAPVWVWLAGARPVAQPGGAQPPGAPPRSGGAASPPAADARPPPGVAPPARGERSAAAVLPQARVDGAVAEGAAPAEAGSPGAAAAGRVPQAATITPPAPPAPAPAGAASAALRLDRAVVREASRASRSAVQQMADARGQPAGDDPSGVNQRLAESVARSVKPDCLPPGGAAGLLTPIVAAYQLATDRCRPR